MTTARRAEPRPSPLRSWRNGWGMALRMARREIGRDRLRTGFVWLMIFLPVAVICGLHIVIASSEISHRDMVFLQTGGGQASLRYLDGAGGTPNWNGAGGVWLSRDGGETPATSVPGWGEPVGQQETAVAKLTGRPALALTWSDLVRSDSQLAVVLGVDLNRSDAAGVAQLASGRLPTTSREVLVTPAGLAGGLPDRGAVTMADDAGNRLDLTVVGVA